MKFIEIVLAESFSSYCLSSCIQKARNSYYCSRNLCRNLSQWRTEHIIKHFWLINITTNWTVSNDHLISFYNKMYIDKQMWDYEVALNSQVLLNYVIYKMYIFKSNKNWVIVKNQKWTVQEKSGPPRIKRTFN